MSKATAKFDFSGARVLVTGGSNGIGLAIASAFADAGAYVTVTGTRATTTDYDKDLSAFNYRQLHVEHNDEILTLANSLSGGLDVLVNNAGAVILAGPEDNKIKAFEDSVRINLFSGHHLANACLDKLSASELPGGASVIGIASLTSFIANPYDPGYGAAKAAIVQMAKTYAELWAGRGIRVNNVAPGLIATRMNEPVQQHDEMNRKFMDATPMKRWGKSEEVADAVLFLASDKAAFITGETLLVDGGYMVNR